MATETEDEITRKIREEEEKVLEKLRDKAVHYPLLRIKNMRINNKEENKEGNN